LNRNVQFRLSISFAHSRRTPAPYTTRSRMMETMRQ